jgi:hypothetical protein
VLSGQRSKPLFPDTTPVRLACVRHAASVHPEPGSNSHFNSLSSPVTGYPEHSIGLIGFGCAVQFSRIKFILNNLLSKKQIDSKVYFIIIIFVMSIYFLWIIMQFLLNELAEKEGFEPSHRY